MAFNFDWRFHKNMIILASALTIILCLNIFSDYGFSINQTFLGIPGTYFVMALQGYILFAVLSKYLG